jgi:hypothetical protein
MSNSSAFLILAPLSFIITVLIEALVIRIFSKDWKKSFLYMFLINLFTWPLAQYFSGQFNIIQIEIAVFLVESILIWKLFEMKYLKAILVSLLINAISFLMGFALSLFLPI